MSAVRTAIIILIFSGISTQFSEIALAERSVEEMIANLENAGSGHLPAESMHKARVSVDKLVGDIPANSSSRDSGAVSNAPIQHFRMAGGIPFPSPDLVTQKPFRPMSQALLDELADAAYAPSPPKIITKPRKCLYNRTIRVEGSGGSVENLLSDSLYLSETLVPPDPSEAFGKQTILYSYREEGDTVMYDLLNTTYVPCVPYRVRVVSNGQFIDEGTNALRNYSELQAGKGKFSAWIATKLGVAP